MNPAVNAAIEQLRGLTVAALKIRFRELFGEESKSSNKQFLFRRIAWRMQANAEGDLSERARRRASEIVSDADLRLRHVPLVIRRIGNRCRNGEHRDCDDRRGGPCESSDWRSVHRSSLSGDRLLRSSDQEARATGQSRW